MILSSGLEPRGLRKLRNGAVAQLGTFFGGHEKKVSTSHETMGLKMGVLLKMLAKPH